jgi:hypothetical protein
MCLLVLDNKKPAVRARIGGSGGPMACLVRPDHTDIVTTTDAENSRFRVSRFRLVTTGSYDMAERKA